MTNIPQDLLYTRDHEWVRISGDQATIGVTDFAQRTLGDIVHADLPRGVGDRLEAAEAFGTLESVKAVSEVYMPLSGTLTEINQSVVEDPELINTDPYGEGWLIRVRMADPAERDALLRAAAYTTFVQEAEND